MTISSLMKVALVKVTNRRVVIATLLIFCTGTMFCQGFQLRLEKTQNGTLKSYSEGPEVLEMNNHSLTEILNRLEIEYLFSIDSTLKDSRFNIKITGNLDKKRSIIEDLNYILDLEFGIQSTPNHEVYWELVNQNKVDQQCPNGVERSIKSINRTWYGTCVKIQDLANQLENWYGIPVNIPEPNSYNISIVVHYDKFEIIQAYLKENNILLRVKDKSNSDITTIHYSK